MHQDFKPIELPEVRKFLCEVAETCEDERLLRLLYSLAFSHTYELEQWQKDELNSRLEANDNEETISWEEVKRKIRARQSSSGQSDIVD